VPPFCRSPLELDTVLALAQYMFVPYADVRIRTLPTPTAPMETAVEAALKSFRENVSAVGRELRSGDSASWASPVAELEESSRSLLEKWRHLHADSPFAEVADEVADLLVATTATFDAERRPPGLARELAKWARARGSRAVASNLRETRSVLGDISLREAARRSGIAPGHLSELEDGQGNLPTVSTAQRLDAALGTHLVVVLTNVRAVLPPAERRRRSTAHAAASVPAGSLDPRLDALFSQIAGDDRLAQVNHDLLSLPAGVRRGIAQMIRSLAAEHAQTRGIATRP
jgi:transcriptional regulator with XRE-family HTH domain